MLRILDGQAAKESRRDIMRALGWDYSDEAHQQKYLRRTRKAKRYRDVEYWRFSAGYKGTD